MCCAGASMSVLRRCLNEFDTQMQASGLCHTDARRHPASNVNTGVCLKELPYVIAHSDPRALRCAPPSSASACPSTRCALHPPPPSWPRTCCRCWAWAPQVRGSLQPVCVRAYTYVYVCVYVCARVHVCVHICVPCACETRGRDTLKPLP